MNKLVVVLLLAVAVTAVCYRPFWLTDDWVKLKIRQNPWGVSSAGMPAPLVVEYISVGEYVPFGRRLYGGQLPPGEWPAGQMGGWWTGWMDCFGQIHVEIVS